MGEQVADASGIWMGGGVSLEPQVESPRALSAVGNTAKAQLALTILHAYGHQAPALHDSYPADADSACRQRLGWTETVAGHSSQSRRYDDFACQSHVRMDVACEQTAL